MIQCLIISENKVHGVGNTATTIKHKKQGEVPDNPITSNELLSHDRGAVEPTKNNTGNMNATTEMPRRLDDITPSTIQAVQPARKIISTGAFIRAFYVFVGLGAIIVMYIVVRTVR
jgi:hypothetical protein